MALLSRLERQHALTALLQEDPFLTDEELADHFAVSVQTIRLDRLILDIPEVRERIKQVAQQLTSGVRALEDREIVGELVALELGRRAVSLLETEPSMTFARSSIVRNHFIFAQAESLALAVIDAEVVLTGFANIKYKQPVRAGERVKAQASVLRRRRSDEQVVLVTSETAAEDVFRGKFVVVEGEDDLERPLYSGAAGRQGS